MEISYTSLKICPETLDSYAFLNAKHIEGKPKAIVLDFHGLGARDLRHEASEFELLLASRGILTIFPYYGPWSWMNSSSVKYVDEIVRVACEKYGLDYQSVTIISSGGSMGGHSALIYSKYATRTPNACVTNCPVCDFKFHATEREDLPRTIYTAFFDSPRGIDAEIEAHSAYHLAPEMPDIPYVVLHGTDDGAVNKKIHSDRFVAKMRECGKKVTYIEVEGMDHCWFEPFPEVKANYYNTIIDLALSE